MMLCMAMYGYKQQNNRTQAAEEGGKLPGAAEVRGALMVRGGVANAVVETMASVAPTCGGMIRVF